MTMRDNVHKGAAWLDTREPLWATRIDLATLRMTTFKQCILGQVFGNYCLEEREMGEDFMFAHGFNLDDTLGDVPEEAWVDLDTYWRQEVYARL